MENDAQLIRRILSGDDDAFNTLVQRHQRGVHALAWRKVSDFHYAEEITQDTLQAYKKLYRTYPIPIVDFLFSSTI